MKIKVGDKIYDAEDELIMIILTPEDKLNITNMTPEATKYCAFPEHVSPETAKEFMKL